MFFEHANLQQNCIGGQTNSQLDASCKKAISMLRCARCHIEANNTESIYLRLAGRTVKHVHLFAGKCDLDQSKPSQAPPSQVLASPCDFVWS